MADKRPLPLLDFSTTPVPREVVKIDGRSYVLRRFDDFSIADGQRIAADIKRMIELDETARTAKGEASRRAERALARVLTRITTAVVDAPSSLLRKLTAGQCGKVIEVFLRLSLSQAAGVKALAALRPIAAPSRGSTLSRNSPGSSAAIRSTGGRATR